MRAKASNRTVEQREELANVYARVLTSMNMRVFRKLA